MTYVSDLHCMSSEILTEEILRLERDMHELFSPHGECLSDSDRLMALSNTWTRLSVAKNINAQRP
jgi:hypothetical protein